MQLKVKLNKVGFVYAVAIRDINDKKTPFPRQIVWGFNSQNVPTPSGKIEVFYIFLIKLFDFNFLKKFNIFYF